MNEYKDIHIFIWVHLSFLRTLTEAFSVGQFVDVGSPRHSAFCAAILALPKPHQRHGAARALCLVFRSPLWLLLHCIGSQPFLEALPFAWAAVRSGRGCS